MWFLVLGILGVALKYFEVGPVATWSWWIVLIPFALAMAWWAWADASGYTKRKVVEREDARLNAAWQALLAELPEESQPMLRDEQRRRQRRRGYTAQELAEGETAEEDQAALDELPRQGLWVDVEV